ncbi:MAG: hypothetical protein RI897_2695 [Verrucomicrobiota bacterium]
MVVPERVFLVGLEFGERGEERLDFQLLAGGEGGGGGVGEPVLAGAFEVGAGIERVGLGEEAGEWESEGT